VSVDFTSFVLFAGMRTGSNLLETHLNAWEGVNCYGEAFNPVFIGKPNAEQLFEMTLSQREEDPLKLLRRMRNKTKGLSGFRFFHDHDARLLPVLLDDAACAKIILTRNPIETYVSWKIAQATGQWKLTQAKRLKTATMRFDGAEFDAHLREQHAFYLGLLRGLQARGQTAFWLDYEDLNDEEVLSGLARFLGVARGSEGPSESLKKQNPESLAEKVENFEEMEAALARLDRFNLQHVPNFEPRRAAGVPAFVALGPALYMPVKSGVEARVEAALADLGHVQRDFTQKSLRVWLQNTAPRRSFTVLRHPLLRAFYGFHEGIVSGRLAVIRDVAQRGWKLKLPKISPQGEVADFASDEAHHDAFLQFLRFLKVNVAGQSGVRVDSGFASQTAVLQGFSQFASPDFILREDRLEAGLAMLRAELGLPPSEAKLDLTPDPMAERLRAILSADVQEACREAYGRDYLNFGFDDWA